MPPGKAASQAGHAFLDSYMECLDSDPATAALYRAAGHGTKVVLEARGYPDLERAMELSRAAGIPCAMVVDSGHVMEPFFDGSPIPTALGIGPVDRARLGRILSRFGCLP